MGFFGLGVFGFGGFFGFFFLLGNFLFLIYVFVGIVCILFRGKGNLFFVFLFIVLFLFINLFIIFDIFLVG